MASRDMTWLNTDYVQKILRRVRDEESIEVSSVTVKPATAKGDNYGSDMQRISVEFSRLQEGQRIAENISLIAKIIPQDAVQAEMLLTGNFFETEMSMLVNTLPKMTEILKEVNTSSLGAQCFYVQREKPAHLVIEDLTPIGFRMVKDQTSLDLNHCLLAVRNLALLHAASVALKEKEPKAFVNYKRGIFHEDNAALVSAIVMAGTKALGEEVSNWPELDQRISEKLIKLSDVIFEKSCELSRYREDDFNVLNHGDCWMNNMMFRYDEQGTPISHIFVDYQVSFYGSATLDLLNFLSTSPSEEVRMNHRELLLREYHALLTSTMEKLKCSTEAPSFDRLKKIMRQRAGCELVPSFVWLPLMLVDKSEAKSWDELVKQDEKVSHPGYKGKLYRKMMTRILPLYDGMGLLDV